MGERMGVNAHSNKNSNKRAAKGADRGKCVESMKSVKNKLIPCLSRPMVQGSEQMFQKLTVEAGEVRYQILAPIYDQLETQLWREMGEIGLNSTKIANKITQTT